MTAAAVLLIAIASRTDIIDRIAPTRRARAIPERLVYVATRLPDPSVASARAPGRDARTSTAPARATTPARDIPRGVPPAIDSASGVPVGPPPRDTASRAAPLPPSTSARAAPRPPAGAPAAGAVAGFVLHPPEPVRFDSATRAVSDALAEGLASGRIRPPPLTQAEVDAKLRAEALERIAARTTGGPTPRMTMVGGGIAVPLPFGGPSRARRERDRAIHAENMKILARIRQRADSVAARRRADSLAHVQDSVPRPIRPG